MSVNQLSLQDAIRQHRKDVLQQEQHEASLQGPKPVVAPPYTIDDAITNTVCDECDELFTGDGTTCDFCLHEDCEDHPCVDCYSESIDRAMDAVERDR